MAIEVPAFETVPEPRPLVPDGAWASVLTDRPRLLGPRAFLRELARSKPALYAEIRAMDSLLAAGIVHAVEGIPKERMRPFVDKALANVARGVTNVHQDTWIWLVEAALAFDFFHEDFPREEHARLFDWLNAHMAVFTDDENAFHNSTLSKIFTYLRIAYATWGENPRAGDFRAYAIEKLYEGRVLPVLLEFGAGGGFTECGWYCRGSLLNLVEALELARRIEGYDGFRKAPRFFYQRLAYDMLQPYPGLWRDGAERYACEGDGANIFSNAMEYPRIMRAMIAQYFRGSDLSRYTAATRLAGTTPLARLMSFLHEVSPRLSSRTVLGVLREGSVRGEDPEPDLSALDLRDFPLSHAAPGIGKVFARSDWSDDATWLRFECGDFWNQHQHFEAGNFEIFRREPLATESGEYVDWDSPHAINWLIRTVAHNCILIYQPDEVFRNIRNRRKIPYANDGGQANDTFIVRTLDEWRAERPRFERGEIVAFEDRGEYLYVAGDSTKAYAPTKAALVLREIVFLRPHTIVILDRVTSTRAQYEKTWLLHCRNEPVIEGRSVTIADGAGRLFVQTLLPEDAGIRKVEGYTYRGQTYEPENDRLSAGAVRWRIEVAPAVARTDDLFLHVLSTDGPTDARVVTRDGDAFALRLPGREILFAPGLKLLVRKA